MAETPPTTPPASTPDIDTSNGAAIAQGIGAVAGAIASIASTAAAVELARLQNPCIRMAVAEDKLIAAEAGINKMISAAQFFASANQASVISAVASWGEAAGNTGGKAFPFWLYDSGAITNPAEAIGCALFPPVCLIAISAGLPPDGSNAPNNSNNGYQVGAGLYRHPGATGTWRGTRFRAEWQAWKTHQESHVWSPATGRPNWRSRLEAWTGRTRSGTKSWAVWIPGDPISPTSLIGRTHLLVAHFREVVEAARIRCQAQEDLLAYVATSETNRLNTLVADAGTAGASAAELAAAQLALAGDELASEERQLTTLSIAGVLGIALIVLMGRK